MRQAGEGTRLGFPSMTGAGTAIKARGCPPIFFENRFPPRPLRGASAIAPAALTAAPPPVGEAASSMVRAFQRRQIMTYAQPISVAADRVLMVLIEGLEIEFGRGAGEALAQRFLDAEDADFHWDARIRERWLGTYAHAEEHDFELDRVAILGQLDGEWFVAVMIVDGDGNAHGMMGRRTFRSKAAASRAFADA